MLNSCRSRYKNTSRRLGFVESVTCPIQISMGKHTHTQWSWPCYQEVELLGIPVRLWWDDQVAFDLLDEHKRGALDHQQAKRPEFGEAELPFSANFIPQSLTWKLNIHWKWQFPKGIFFSRELMFRFYTKLQGEFERQSRCRIHFWKTDS